MISLRIKQQLLELKRHFGIFWEFNNTLLGFELEPRLILDLPLITI